MPEAEHVKGSKRILTRGCEPLPFFLLLPCAEIQMVYIFNAA